MKIIEEEIARFLSADPIKADEESPYTYVKNSPLNFMDPSGLYYFSYKKEINGKYAVFFVPEDWLGIDQTPVLVGYTDTPGGSGWLSSIPKSKVERPGYCSLLATQFVSEKFPSTKEGWDEFFLTKCASAATTQGTAPADSIVDAPQMCTGSAPGATSSTFAAGFSLLPFAISKLLSDTLKGLIVAYIPYTKVARLSGWIVKKVGVKCAENGKK